jgi:DNA-directed RNA polymerase, mitochondrial
MSISDDEQNKSIERELKQEDRCIRSFGFGHSVQGRTLHQHLLHSLCAATDDDRKRWINRDKPIDKKIWRHISRRDTRDIADRLLVAGLTVAHERQIYGIAVTWIGKCLGQRDKETALRVGSWGINMLCTLQIFAVEKEQRENPGPDNIFVMHWDGSMRDLVAEARARRIGRNHLLQPMLTPPLPWKQVDQGIVPPDDWASVLLVDHGQAVESAQREAIAHGRMSDALEAVNYLQSVPVSIHTPSLDLRLDPHCPAQPLPPAGHEPPACDWAKRNDYIEAVSIRNQWDTDLTTARVMAMAGRCWLPKNWDFRGRIYDVPDFCYQRDDANRALFDFADAEPAGPDGLQYINYHLAGQADGVTFAPKKPSRLNFAERQAWVFNNREALRAVGEAALRGEWPRAELLPGADDDVFQYIRACIEFVRADNDPNFVSHLPVSLDGCCSVQQHMSAMMRDEVCGRYVHLAPGGTLDFYEAVAEEVSKSSLVMGDYECIELCAAAVMDDEHDRKLVKAPAMTWGYRATIYRMAEQVRKVLEMRGQDARYAYALAKAIDAAVRKIAPRAVVAREEFLEPLVDICSAHGMALQWTTYDGMPVINQYFKPDTHNYNYPLNGGRVRIRWVRGDLDEVRGLKARNAVTANFVHSLDATHLRLVARAAKAEGIGMLCIHDSFAFLPSQVRKGGQIIREQFVRLHSRDPLLQVLEETKRRLQAFRHARPWTAKTLTSVTLPSLPPRGTLDVSQILHSERAFA